MQTPRSYVVTMIGLVFTQALSAGLEFVLAYTTPLMYEQMLVTEAPNKKGVHSELTLDAPMRL